MSGRKSNTNVAFVVAPCNLSAPVSLGSSTASHHMHIEQNEFDQIVSLHDFVPLSVTPAHNGVSVGDGNFSRFDVSLLTNGELIDFSGASQFSKLSVDTRNGSVRYVMFMLATKRR